MVRKKKGGEWALGAIKGTCDSVMGLLGPDPKPQGRTLQEDQRVRK